MKTKNRKYLYITLNALLFIYMIIDLFTTEMNFKSFLFQELIPNYQIYFIIFLGALLGINITFYYLLKMMNIKSPDVLDLPKYPDTYNTLQFVVGEVHDENDHKKIIKKPKWYVIPEKGLYQGNICFGTIGSGKTAGIMYPFLENMFQYRHDIDSFKFAGYIVDVKGSFINQVYDYAIKYGRVKLKPQVNEKIVKNKLYNKLKADDFEYSDVYKISLDDSGYTWNPVWRPEDDSSIIAGDFRTILESLHAGSKGQDPFWLDNAVKLFSYVVDLLRVANDKIDDKLPSGYFTMVDMYYVMVNEDVLEQKLDEYLEKFDKVKAKQELVEEDKILIQTFFSNDLAKWDSKIKSIIITEINRMFSVFTKPRYAKIFCPSYEQAMNTKTYFEGFEKAIATGKIVVPYVPFAKYGFISIIIVLLLKESFKRAVLNSLSDAQQNMFSNKSRPIVFLGDEYQRFVNPLDAQFFDAAREARLIPMLSTQMVSSLGAVISDNKTLETIIGNLSNSYMLRSADEDTAKRGVKLAGKKKELKLSTNVSKSQSNKKDESISVNTNEINENIYEEHFFLNMNSFTCVMARASDGLKTLPPAYIYLKPFFQKNKKESYFNFLPTMQKYEKEKYKEQSKILKLLNNNESEKILNLLKLDENNTVEDLVEELNKRGITYTTNLHELFKNIFLLDPDIEEINKKHKEQVMKIENQYGYYEVPNHLSSEDDSNLKEFFIEEDEAYKEKMKELHNMRMDLNNDKEPNKEIKSTLKKSTIMNNIKNDLNKRFPEDAE